MRYFMLGIVIGLLIGLVAGMVMLGGTDTKIGSLQDGKLDRSEFVGWMKSNSVYQDCPDSNRTVEIFIDSFGREVCIENLEYRGWYLRKDVYTGDWIDR